MTVKPIELPALVVLGGDPEDAFLEPRVDASGAFVLEHGERMLATEKVSTEVLRSFGSAPGVP